MKKIFIIFVNVIIMAAILIFVVLYSRFSNRDSNQRQIEYFENTTVTMEQVTENYLEGEQRICSSLLTRIARIWTWPMIFFENLLDI